MIIKSLTLISFILIIALFFVLISFISVIILNKKLIRAKNEIENFEDEFETAVCQNILHEFEVPVSIIIGLIDRLKKTIETNVDSGSFEDFEMLSNQSEKLKSLIGGVNSLSNLKDWSDSENIVFGNVISFYQYLFESFSEMAEIKKVDFLFHSNIRILNINYCPDYLRTIFCNPIGKLLEDCSEGDKVKIEVTLNKNLKHYKLEFINSSSYDYQSVQMESDLALMVTKRVVNRLNGLFEIKHSPKGEIIYYMNLPLSNDSNIFPEDCLTIHKSIKTGMIYEYIHEPKPDNNIKHSIDPEFLNRVTSLIFREITNTDNLIDVISSELCISSSQLNRRIKLMAGMTTSNFILKTRLNRAKKQLTATQKPIGEIAMGCGFNDFAYFSRSFKKEFEMTPTTFQRLPH